MAEEKKETANASQENHDVTPAVKMDTGTNRDFEITLPSYGIPYEGKLPGGRVKLRPMTTAEEAILYNAAGDAVSKVNAIINACVVSKSMATEELLLSDRFYILLMLRTRSFGARYKFPFRCSGCNAQSKQEVNLVEDLTIKPMESGLQEPFDVLLPISGDTVSLRFLRGKDEARIARHAKRVRMQSSDPSDPSYLYRLALQIVTINGVEKPLLDVENYVAKMDVGDSAKIRAETDLREGGIDTTIYIDCPFCGFTNEMEMPFSVEFFRPNG